MDLYFIDRQRGNYNSHHMPMHTTRGKKHKTKTIKARLKHLKYKTNKDNQSQDKKLKHKTKPIKARIKQLKHETKTIKTRIKQLIQFERQHRTHG